MAARLIALFRPPDDPAAFDAHYRDVHAPIVRRYPGLRDLRVTRTDGVAGRPADIYLLAEMTFDSRADLDAALASEPGRESGRDLRTFAQAGVTLLVADDEAPFLER
ncbi:MAG: EthD family reductase [Candidatus Limnocylindria bacterium]